MVKFVFQDVVALPTLFQSNLQILNPVSILQNFQPRLSYDPILILAAALILSTQLILQLKVIFPELLQSQCVMAFSHSELLPQVLN